MLASFYADDALVRVIDRNNPPSKPREIRGRAAISTFWDDICSRAMTHKVDTTIADGDSLAFTQACAYPDGTKVFCRRDARAQGRTHRTADRRAGLGRVDQPRAPPSRSNWGWSSIQVLEHDLSRKPHSTFCFTDLRFGIVLLPQQWRRTNMFSARWQIDAKFGHKQTVLELLKKWEREIGSQVGIADLKFQIMTGSIGAREATVEFASPGRKPGAAGGVFRQDRQDRRPCQMGQGDGALCRVGHQPVEHLSHCGVAALLPVHGRRCRTSR